MVCILNGVVFIHKEGGNYVICGKMDGPENLMLSQLRQTQKDKCSMFFHMCKVERRKEEKEKKIFMKIEGRSLGWRRRMWETVKEGQGKY